MSDTDIAHVWVILCETTDRGVIGSQDRIEGAYLREPEAVQEATRLNEAFKHRWARNPRGSTESYRVDMVRVYRIELEAKP